MIVNYDHKTFIVQATVIMIINYDRTVIMIVNYDHKTFIGQAADLQIFCNQQKKVDVKLQF
jgi:hypothetical protein